MSSHLNNNPPENLKGYFVIQFSKDTDGKGTYENYKIQNDAISADGQKSGAYLSFNTEQDETVEIRIGTSFVSVDQARANIEQEIGDKEFNEVKEETKNIWNDRLNAIQIEGATESENHIFYTAMYHALLYPRTFYEVEMEKIFTLVLMMINIMKVNHILIFHYGIHLEHKIVY